MKHKRLSLSLGAIALVGILLVAGLAGCGSSAPEGDIPENAALTIRGQVKTEVGWTEEEIRAMDTMKAESTNKEGETKTYTGVAINDLLAEADPNPEATTLVFVADDGYSVEVALTAIQACKDCIVSFRNQGGFSIVAPEFPGDVQVKGVIEIQAK